jgi:hypothetical protein
MLPSVRAGLLVYNRASVCLAWNIGSKALGGKMLLAIRILIALNGLLLMAAILAYPAFLPYWKRNADSSTNFNLFDHE